MSDAPLKTLIPTPNRIGPRELAARCRGEHGPLLLDARRSDALRDHPLGLPLAVPLLLDETPLRLPDLPRDTPVVAYCACSGQASSTRVALLMLARGYRDVGVLEGGLPAWEAAGLPVAALSPADRSRVPRWMHAGGLRVEVAESPIAEFAFLAGEALPMRRELAVLFVDIVDSTSLFLRHPPERVLKLVQAVMETVVKEALVHCGDVHDFEGDGAMLYFAGPGEALPAAFAIRERLAGRRAREPDLPLLRYALDAGPLVVGRVGTGQRRGLSFIGPADHAAARILRLAPPEAIAATRRFMAAASQTAPDLAKLFRPLPDEVILKGFNLPVQVLLARERGSQGRASEPEALKV